MAMIHKHYRYLILIMSLFGSSFTHLTAIILLPGNSNNANESFTFNIGAHAFYTPTALFYISSKDQGAQDYALSFAARNNRTRELRFFPMAPSKIILNLLKNENGQYQEVDNPLYDAQIALLTTYASGVLATKTQALNQVYLLENFTASPVFLTSSPIFNDSNGIPTPFIISLETQTAQAIGSISDKDTAQGFFAAVTNANGLFNGNGSGIAYAYLQDERSQQTQAMINRSIIISDAQADPNSVILNREISTNTNSINTDSSTSETESAGLVETPSNDDSLVDEGAISQDDESVTRAINLENNDGNRARAIELNEPTLAIGADLLDIGSNVKMRWDGLLQKLYVGLNVQAGQAARGVLVASQNNGVINFQSIAPDAVFTSSNSLVGTNIPGETVAINNITTLQTTTYLTYLIVLNGTHDVYAMPLVQAPESEDGRHGTLANVNSIPVLDASPEPFYRFQGRRFIIPAVTADDVFTTQSLPAQVGGGSAPAAVIEMKAFKDAVFIATQEVGINGEAPGIFYSQALFDDVARIKGWTPWQRTGVVSGPLAGFNFGSMTGDFYTIPFVNGATHSGYVTSWGLKSNPLESFVHAQFPKKISGVQGMIDFPVTTTGFSEVIGSRIAVTALTGYKKVMLLQTGADQNNVFSSNDYNYAENVFENTHGSLENFTAGVAAVSLAGGALSTLKAIVSAEYVSDGSNSWWVVGGSGGIAVLARTDGTGVDQTSGLQAGFAGLTSDMRFINIASDAFVRKLISFGNELFVLTASSLEKITLTVDGIANNNCQRTLLASVPFFTDGSASFADVAISGPLALLATSIGLFRSGNSVDIQTAISESTVHWVPVELNEVAGSFETAEKKAIGPITQLLAISPTGNAKEWYTNDRALGGNMYVLNGEVAFHQAQVYRLNFNDGTVTDTSVVPFPDYFVLPRKSFFVSLTDYRNGIQTDGSVFMVGRSAYLGNSPFVSVLSNALRSNQINGGGVRSTQVVLRENAYKSLGRIIRLSALGAWAVNGDFGIRLHN